MSWVELVRWLARFTILNSLVCWLRCQSFSSFHSSKSRVGCFLCVAVSFSAFSVVRSFVIVMRWFEVSSILSMFLVHFYSIPLKPLQKLNWSVSKLKLLFKSPTCFEEWEKKHQKEIHNVRIELNFAAEIRSICSIQVLNNYKICLCRWMWIYRASCMRT